MDPWRVTLASDPKAVRYTPQPGLALPEGTDEMFLNPHGVVRDTLAALIDVSEAVPWDEPWRRGLRMVVATREAIVIDEKEVLRLEDGRIPAGAIVEHGIPPLREEFFRRRDDVMLLVDGGLRHADMVAVLTSAADGGVWRRHVAVRAPNDPPGAASGAFQVSGPYYTHGSRREAVPPALSMFMFEWRPLVLVMRVTNAAVELGELLHTGEFRALGRVGRDEGWEPVARIAFEAALRDVAEKPGMVVFGAEDDVPVARVFAALATVTGGHCGPPREACGFAEPLLVSGEMSLQAMGAGLGGLTVAEGERRSTHRSGKCSARMRQGVVTMRIGHWMYEDIVKVPGAWLEVEQEPGAPATLRVIPPWLAVPGDRDGPDLAYRLSERSGCARYRAELYVDAPRVSGEVDLDCAIGEVTLLGRVRFDCPLLSRD